MADLDLQDEDKADKKLSVAEVMENDDREKPEVHEEPKSQSSAGIEEAALDVVMADDKADNEVIEDAPPAKP